MAKHSMIVLIHFLLLPVVASVTVVVLLLLRRRRFQVVAYCIVTVKLWVHMPELLLIPN